MLTLLALPLFITFEGLDGSGKTTQLKRLSEALTQENIQHICTREPGGEPFAEAMRDLLLHHPASRSISPYTQALCMTAARIEHVKNTIQPARQAGKWVLCDRFTDSTTAYQGYGAGVEHDFLKKLHKRVGCSPDVTFVLQVPPEQAIKRIAQRTAKPSNGATVNHLDTQTLAFYQRANEGFIAMTGRRYLHIDGTQDEEVVARDIAEKLKNHLGTKHLKEWGKTQKASRRTRHPAGQKSGGP